ncbi:MAG TPA: hypothetical protein VGX16_03180 [Solirubrobacteraceae bacterium]|nr:hypothetical protein [Solirubrobacteraceae bacterium]
MYFVATGQLLKGLGSDGAPNLYLAHEPAAGEPGARPEIRFVATLSSEDSSDWTPVPANLQAYVTPGGHDLAFTSRARVPTAESPLGYDNRDRAGVEGPDSEVYRYDAPSATLRCASCDPSGARPLGPAFVGAATRPGESEVSAGTPFHRPRALNDAGTELFFTSFDALAPGLGGARGGIYEYAPGRAPRLIAGGAPGATGTQGGEGEVFLDASPSGADVYFATRDRLVPSDRDGLVDIYDARVEGGFPEASPGGACAGVGACPGASGGSLGTPPTALAPRSSTFRGRGVPRRAKSHRRHARRHRRARRRGHVHARGRGGA